MAQWIVGRIIIHKCFLAWVLILLWHYSFFQFFLFVYVHITRLNKFGQVLSILNKFKSIWKSLDQLGQFWSNLESLKSFEQIWKKGFCTGRDSNTSLSVYWTDALVISNTETRKDFAWKLEMSRSCVDVTIFTQF